MTEDKSVNWCSTHRINFPCDKPCPKCNELIEREILLKEIELRVEILEQSFPCLDKVQNQTCRQRQLSMMACSNCKTVLLRTPPDPWVAKRLKSSPTEVSPPRPANEFPTGFPLHEVSSAPASPPVSEEQFKKDWDAMHDSHLHHVSPPAGLSIEQVQKVILECSRQFTGVAPDTFCPNVFEFITICLNALAAAKPVLCELCAARNNLGEVLKEREATLRKDVLEEATQRLKALPPGTSRLDCIAELNILKIHPAPAGEAPVPKCICAQGITKCPKHADQPAQREICPLCKKAVLGYCVEGEYCTSDTCRYVH